MARPETRTLVVGGEYTTISGVPHVNRRWLMMVEIFCASISTPVFALRYVNSDDQVFYSARFPYDVVPIRPLRSQSFWQVPNPVINFEKRWHKQLVENVDAVYCRFPSSYWDGYHIYNVARQKGKVLFASIHGDWAGVYDNLAANAPLPKKVAYRVASILSHRALTKVARTSRVLFCVGPGLDRKYGERARASISFANYLHKESDIWHRNDSCLTKPIRIIYVGALSPRKGVSVLIRVVARLISQGYPIVLSIVGTGEQKSQLIDLAISLGIEDYIEWHGYIDFGEGILDKYRESDIFVLPSVAGEGMPKVVVEAMSQGLPVIATNTGSTQDIIRTSKSGILVPPGDEERMLKSLVEFIEDSALRRLHIGNGIAFAAQMTNERQRETVAETFKNFLPELLASNT